MDLSGKPLLAGGSNCMRRFLFILTMMLFLSCMALGQTTPNLGLNLPPRDARNWDQLVNQNFSILDSVLSFDSGKIWHMGSSDFPCDQTGLTAALTAANAVGGTVDARACPAMTVSVANSVGDGTHSVALLIPPNGAWTLAGITDGTSCFFTLHNGSSIVGNGAVNGGSKFTMRGDTATNNADSMICTLAPTYTRIQGGLLLYNPAPGTPGTFVNGLLHWRQAFDGSSVRDVTIANYAGIGAFVDSPCCGATWEKVILNGGGLSGAIPLIIDNTTNAIGMSFSCINCSTTHAAADQHEIEIKETSAGITGPINFFNHYFEGNAVAHTVSHVKITKARGGVNFYGGSAAIRNLTETVPVFEVDAASNTDLELHGFLFWEGPTPSTRVTDNISGVTIQTPPFNWNYIPHYSTYSPSTRSYSGTKVLSGGTGTITFTKQFQTVPICTATDQTAANPVKVAPTATQLVLTGTTTDTIAWRCDGNPN